MTPARLIDLYLHLRAGLTGQPSATGRQLERLRLNLPSGANMNSIEEQRSFFSHLVYAVERLDDDQRKVIFALRTPLPHQAECPAISREAPGECATETCGALKYYEREVRDGDLRVVERDNPNGSKERTQETLQGERYLRAARDKEGEPRPGFVVVAGARSVYPTREQVAEQLGIGFSKVKRLISEAYEKLESGICDESEEAYTSRIVK